MLADTSNTYEYISQYLKLEGYEISKSSVGSYAMRSNTATPVSYTHLDVYKRQGSNHRNHPLSGFYLKNLVAL